MVKLPKSYIKKYGISKKAWSEFRKSKSRTTKSKTPGRKKMGKRKRKRGSNLQAKVFKWLRIGALAAPGAIYATQPISLDQKVNEILRVYSGVNVKHSIESDKLQFSWERLAMGWLPFLTTTLATYGIPKIAGILRRL